MQIIVDENKCESVNCKKNKKYEVLQITNEFGECVVDLSFQIENESGEKIWIDDWDCMELPRVDRKIFY